MMRDLDKRKTVTVWTDLKNWIVDQPLWLWLILLLALFLRLFQINHVGLWTDEAFSVLAARDGFWVMLNNVVDDGVHPPFYYFFLFQLRLKSLTSLLKYG